MKLFSPSPASAIIFLAWRTFCVIHAWSPGSTAARNGNGLPRRDLFQQVLAGSTVGVAAGGGLLLTGALFPDEAIAAEVGSPKKLTFETLADGVKFADIIEGTKSTDLVQSNSKVTFHVVGRLLGKQGWIFMNTAEQDDDPYRLEMGAGVMIQGLEEGMVGMKVGGKRRIVIPSAVGYKNKSLEPIPRDFGNRQRLYTTVMNSVRVDREREALGADLAGVVVMDVELVRIRK